MSANGTAAQPRLRFAIYARYSSEMQTDLSIEAQVDRCRKAIASRGGAVIEVFKDEAISGWSLERPGFQAMQAAAARGRFDAIMFWKFDRLARSHDHVVMIKMLLRKQFDLKLYCVEGYSEDDDGSAYGAMMEQMIAVFSAFYSRNLSSETKRGKQQRAMRGEYNGSKSPLGYDMVTAREATADRPYGLYVNARQAALVRRAFRLYASGSYSDSKVADWLNQRPAIQKLRKGKKPFDKEMVRDMLQNRLYTGRVGHTDTIYRGSLGEKRTTKRGRAEWYEGKHAAIVADDLFERCQEVRAAARKTFKVASQMRTYLVGDRVLCLRCALRKPADLVDPNYGRMRPSAVERDNTSYYRCTASTRGYERCGQCNMRVADVDRQLVEALSTLQVPDGVQARIDAAVTSRSANEANLRRIDELKAQIERVNFSWEQGFLSPEEYTEKRGDLQREMAALRPVDYDELQDAADLVRHFRVYWDACAALENPAEARKELVAQIVDSVYVYDRRVVAVTFYADYAVVLGENETAHAHIARAAQSHLEQLGSITSFISSQCGDDGSRYGSGCVRVYELPRHRNSHGVHSCTVTEAPCKIDSIPALIAG